jgi:hypothetical protein
MPERFGSAFLEADCACSHGFLVAEVNALAAAHGRIHKMIVLQDLSVDEFESKLFVRNVVVVVLRKHSYVCERIL